MPSTDATPRYFVAVAGRAVSGPYADAWLATKWARGYLISRGASTEAVSVRPHAPDRAGGLGEPVAEFTRRVPRGPIVVVKELDLVEVPEPKGEES